MKKRIKRSVIWKISRNEFEKICKNSKTLTEILNKFNLKMKGGNFNGIKRRIEEEGIDISHISRGLACNKGKKFGPKKQLSELLVENSTYSRGHLKERLLKEELLKNQCSICNLKDIWNNKHIVMVLDHINGIYNDNRLKNLRLVCPNCNSQFPTFCKGTKK